MVKTNTYKSKKLLLPILAILIFSLLGYSIYNNMFSGEDLIENDELLTQGIQKEDNQSNKDTTSSHYTETFNGISLTKDDIGIPILYYHSVRPSADNEVIITPKKLKSELQYLKDEGYTTLTISELHDYLLNNSPIPKKSIIITFDDGYMDNYYNAFPILKELGMKATIFCVTSKLDGSYYLSVDAIKEMSDYGIDIQSHTVTHPKLDSLTYDKQLAELKESKNILESITGKAVTSIAYPFGNFNDDTIKAAKAAGYSLGFTTNRGLADRKDDSLKIDRIYVSSNYDLKTFKEILATTIK